MIQILGFKRVVTLAILVAANLVLAGMLYYVVLPQKNRTDNELRAVRAAVDGRRAEVTRLQTEFEQIQEQKSLFGQLEKSGFFGTQDRLGARKTIESIQSTSRVLGARYSIEAATVIEDPIVAEAQHVILNTPVKVAVDALDDVDFYSFMYWIENAFPGQASIKKFSLERKLDVEEATLRQIGNGTPAILVSGNVEFTWSTMVPKSQVPQQLGQPAIPQ